MFKHFLIWYWQHHRKRDNWQVVSCHCKCSFISFSLWSEFQKTQHILLISLIDLFDQCENAVLAREHDFK